MTGNFHLDHQQHLSHSLNASTSTAVRVPAGLIKSTVTAAKLPSWPSALPSARGRDDGTVTATSAHRDETWQIDLGRSAAHSRGPESPRAPLPLKNRLPLPNAGDAETLAFLGSQARRQAHLWKYMLSEVRPHERLTACWAGWTMMDAESIRLVGKMDPPVTSAVSTLKSIDLHAK